MNNSGHWVKRALLGYNYKHDMDMDGKRYYFKDENHYEMDRNLVKMIIGIIPFILSVSFKILYRSMICFENNLGIKIKIMMMMMMMLTMMMMMTQILRNTFITSFENLRGGCKPWAILGLARPFQEVSNEEILNTRMIFHKGNSDG